MKALAVDEELSPLVRRSFSLDTEHVIQQSTQDEAVKVEVSPRTGGALYLRRDHRQERGLPDDPSRAQQTFLVTEYRATTNRMLRVAVNGFFESVSVILGCMRELDEDIASNAWIGEGESDVDTLDRVQGLQDVGVI